MRRLLFLFSMLAFCVQMTAQINAVPPCHVEGNPNSIANMNVVNQLYECAIAKDTVGGNLYVYDVTQTVGSRWVMVQTSADTDTRLDNPRIVGSDLVFDVIDVNTSADLGDVSIALLDIQDGVVTGASATGTGDTRTITLTRSNGLADIVFTINVADSDSDTTNELQTISTADGTNNGTTTLSDSGGSFTISGDSEINVDVSGTTYTITNTALPVYVSNSAALTALGVGKKYRCGLGSIECTAGDVRETY